MKCTICHKKLVTTRSKTGLCKPCYAVQKKPQEVRQKISAAKTGSKNPNWSGDDVSYKGLHNWANANWHKPELCEICKTSPARDLANKGVYDRHRKNWEWLCRRCHMQKDGRLDQVKKGEWTTWGKEKK